ncbi:MAG: hypothetical protein N2381_07060, partial [Armatimonadetes bacterium]|nr:hypothetical protein [Armatimonadota bacterium]
MTAKRCAACVLLSLITTKLLLQEIAVTQCVTTSLNLRLRQMPIDGLSCVELLSGENVVLRIRHKSALECNAIARKLLDTLHSAVLSLATEKDVSVQRVKGGYKVLIGDAEAILIDHVIARNSRSLVDKLANIVAERLKDLLRRPYLAVPIDEVTIGVGETKIIAILGTADGQWRVSVAPHDVASVSFDATTKMLRLSAFKAADGNAIVSCGNAKLTLPIRIRARAARLLRSPIAIATDTAPVEFTREAAINAILNSVERMPGAQLRFELLGKPSNDFPDEVLIARLKAYGAEYLPLDANAAIRILRIPPMRESAAALLVSNEPERIHTEQVLSAGMLPNTGKPIRLLYHHVNASGETLWLRLELFNTSENEAQIMAQFAHAGPITDEIHSGYTAVSMFLRRWFDGAAFVLELPPRSIYVLSESAMPAGTTITGLWEITPVVGGSLGYQIRATRERSQWRIIPLTAPIARDIPIKARQFAEPMKLITARHTVGSDWAFIHIGREPIRGLDKEHLHGNYGVIYRITVEVENNKDTISTYELAFMPNAGIARCAAIVDGEFVSAPLILSLIHI